MIIYFSATKIYYMKTLILPVVALVFCLASCTSEKGPLPIVKPKSDCDSTVHYSTTIASIVSLNCSTKNCHNAGSVNGDFTTYSGINAKVTNSSLINRVVTLKNMPSSGPLSDADISRVKCWVEQGAPNN